MPPTAARFLGTYELRTPRGPIRAVVTLSPVGGLHVDTPDTRLRGTYGYADRLAAYLRRYGYRRLA